jgi:hypothetical protein
MATGTVVSDLAFNMSLHCRSRRGDEAAEPLVMLSCEERANLNNVLHLSKSFQRTKYI